MMNRRAQLPTDPILGSNLKGSAAGAAWTYLLDSLELDQIVCVGRPGPGAAATLERIAKHVIVADQGGLDELPAGSSDLIYVTASSRAAVFAPGALASLVRVLAPDGRLYVEDRRPGGLAPLLEEAGLDEINTFWLTPAHGEMRSAIPLEDERVRRFFVANGITVSSLGRLLRRFEPLFPMAASRNRIGMIARATSTESRPRIGVPSYIRNLAMAEGIDLSAHRFGLSARGRYSSRKIILYLFGPDSDRPDLIIKATRDPVHNERLVNEEQALRHVAALGLVAPGTAPGVVFSGEHGGLRFVAETAVDGALLSGRSHGIGGAAAYSWLTDLSVNSARRDSASSATLVSTLEGIESTMGRIYPLDPSDRAHLRHATRTLIENVHRLPVVFTHGDASTWNARLRPDGRIAFMDWEAAEVQGMPLWDTFYFARSHILWGARLRELARRPTSMVRALHADPGLRKAIADYCGRLGIPAGLIGPLFSMCWAHRALREASRLEAGRLHEGHYLGLLRGSFDAALVDAWTGPTNTNGVFPL